MEESHLERRCLHCGGLLDREKYNSEKYCCNVCRKRYNASQHYKANKPEVKYTAKIGEAEVVEGLELSKFLRSWRERYNLTYGLEGFSNETQIPYLPAVEWLAQETGLHPRRVSGLVRGEFPFVPFSQVDKILTVIGHTQLMANNVIEVIPNPRWSIEDWVSYMQERGCC